MIERSIVPLLPESGRVSYMHIGKRRYHISTRPCAQTCMPGHCENFSLTHPEWSTYQVTNELFGRQKGQQIRDLKPLICFHGFSQSSSTWDSIYLPGYLLIGIDLLGHGGSSAPSDLSAYSYESLLTDLHTIIQTRVSGEYALMGYSQGARLALLYALRYGQEVSKLVLESGSVGIQEEAERANRKTKDYALADSLEEKGIAWFEETWSKVPIFASQEALPEAVKLAVKRRRLHNNPQGLAQALRGIGQGSMPYVGQQVENLTMPYLYIAGALDAKYSAIGDRYFSHNCKVIPRVGHNVHLEAPEQYSILVHQFLENQ